MQNVSFFNQSMQTVDVIITECLTKRSTKLHLNPKEMKVARLFFTSPKNITIFIQNSIQTSRFFHDSGCTNGYVIRQLLFGNIIVAKARINDPREPQNYALQQF